MIIILVSGLFCFLMGILFGLVLFAPMVISTFFQIWETLPIATLSTCEVFIVCFYLIYLLINKLFESALRNEDIIAKVIFFATALFAFYLLIYTIREDSYLHNIFFLREIAAAAAAVYEKIHSLFEEIITAIADFLHVKEILK